MKKILIVDDSKMIIDLLTKEINKVIPNTKIISAFSYKDGAKAILKYGTKIDAAILDLNLPDAKEGKILDLVESNNIKSVVLSEVLNDEHKDNIIEKNSIVECIAKDGKKSIATTINSINRILNNKNKYILIVEDAKAQASKLKNIIEKMNLHVNIAYDGEEAYELLLKNKDKYTLVITDFYMPKLDGLELTFKIREVFNKDELGIIALSSENDSCIISKFLKLGANDYIKKPFDELEVITRVNALLDLIELFKKNIEMANKDFLTGAYNRRYFFEAVKNSIHKSKRSNSKIALVMMDIDHFKNINDTYGHDTGDKVICNVVDILNKSLRKSDLFARFGGEEFVIVLEDLEYEDINNLLEKIRKTFESNTMEINNTSIKFTISAGVYYGKAIYIDEMLKIADDSLYMAKNKGRNNIFYYIDEPMN